MALLPKTYTTQGILNKVYDATTGGLKIAGTVNGNLTITGDLTVNGNFTFGDATTDVLTVTGVIRNANGTAAIPSYSFTGDPDTGFYSYGANSVGLTVSGTVNTVWSSSGFQTGTIGSINNSLFRIYSQVANGASVTGIALDNATALTIAGSKLVSFRNATTEKAAIGIGGEVMGSNGTAALPTFTSLADPNTGIFFNNDDTIRFSSGGTEGAHYTGGSFYAAGVLSKSASFLGLRGQFADGASAYGVKIGNTNALTIPGAKIIGFFSDGFTTEKAYIDKDGFYGHPTSGAVTASTTQSQGQGAITAEIVNVSTCANANDTVTLPTAKAGIRCYIFNNGAQTLQIFPASGDNLGAGVDTAKTLAAGKQALFVAYDDTNWQPVLGANLL